ncbi:toxin-antitoxin system, toxin component [Streptomyces sp. NPDC048664]|uniref:toxin-antitoxin system, toxin component n=1 Tax=Streptomyces sp. NPDC048664 TaxID=3154505 RepID=UPI003445C568
MRQLSDTLLTRLAEAAPRDDEEIFVELSGILTELRGREVALMRAGFPLGTVSGLWLDLEDRDVIAVRDDTTNSEHEHVILGHEIWHMFEGHCGTPGAGGRASARSDAARAEVVEEVVAQVLGSRAQGLDARDAQRLGYAARTRFDHRHEAEAEMFGLRLGTDLRTFRRNLWRAGTGQVAARIEDSLSRGL